MLVKTSISGSRAEAGSDGSGSGGGDGSANGVDVAWRTSAVQLFIVCRIAAAAALLRAAAQVEIFNTQLEFSQATQNPVSLLLHSRCRWHDYEGSSKSLTYIHKRAFQSYRKM